MNENKVAMDKKNTLKQTANSANTERHAAGPISTVQKRFPIRVFSTLLITGQWTTSEPFPLRRWPMCSGVIPTTHCASVEPPRPCRQLPGIRRYTSSKVVSLPSTQHLIPRWSGCAIAAYAKEKNGQLKKITPISSNLCWALYAVVHWDPDLLVNLWTSDTSLEEIRRCIPQKCHTRTNKLHKFIKLQPL